MTPINYLAPVQSLPSIRSSLWLRVDRPGHPRREQDRHRHPRIQPRRSRNVDDHLHRMRRNAAPAFVVTDIRPAPNNLAGATVATGFTATHAPQTDRAGRSGRALADHPRRRDERNGRVLAGTVERGTIMSSEKPRMNWTKLSVATTLAAASIASPATAYADCGDTGQAPCTGPVPTVDQVIAMTGRPRHSCGQQGQHGHSRLHPRGSIGNRRPSASDTRTTTIYVLVGAFRRRVAWRCRARTV